MCVTSGTTISCRFSCPKRAARGARCGARQGAHAERPGRRSRPRPAHRSRRHRPRPKPAPKPKPRTRTRKPAAPPGRNFPSAAKLVGDGGRRTGRAADRRQRPGAAGAALGRADRAQLADGRRGCGRSSCRSISRSPPTATGVRGYRRDAARPERRRRLARSGARRSASRPRRSSPAAAGSSPPAAARSPRLRAADGEQVWSKAAGAMSERPAIDGDALYLPLTEGQLRRSSSKTGELIWAVRSAPSPTEPLVYAGRRLPRVRLRSASCASTPRAVDEAWDWDVGTRIIGPAAADAAQRLLHRDGQPAARAEPRQRQPALEVPADLSPDQAGRC